MTELLTQGLLKWNITLSDKQLDQFMQYYKLLVDKNKVMNLTAITEYNEVVQKHFLDSLSLILAPVFRGEGSVIDVGTGAGFPGIPLKIAFPHLKVTLLDSLNKRVNFLKETTDALGLKRNRMCTWKSRGLLEEIRGTEKNSISVCHEQSLHFLY